MNLFIYGLLSLVIQISWTTAVPITMYLFNNNARQFASPSASQWSPMERSDQTIQATSSGGYTSNDYGHQSQGGFEPSTGDNNDYNNFASYNHDSSQNLFEQNQNLENSQASNHHAHAIPVSQHVEVTKPLLIEKIKEIGVPVLQPVKINVPGTPQLVPQHYPVFIPNFIENKKLVPFEKHVPVPVEKSVPFHITRFIPQFTSIQFPVRIPVMKTIYHYAKSYDD